MKATPKERTMANTANRGVPLPGLRAVRQRSGLTQRELAKIAGVGKGTVSELEAGKRCSYPRTRRRLAEALGAELTHLME